MLEEYFFTYQRQITFTIITLIALTVFQFILKKMALLLSWGYELSELSLVFSSVFAVLGVALFAIWSILSNVTAGVILFFSFPYKIGNKIKIHDKDLPVEAIIEDIKAFHLHLRTADGELITYPNNLILQKAVSLVEREQSDEGKAAL